MDAPVANEMFSWYELFLPTVEVVRGFGAITVVSTGKMAIEKREEIQLAFPSEALDTSDCAVFHTTHFFTVQYN